MQRRRVKQRLRRVLRAAMGSRATAIPLRWAMAAVRRRPRHQVRRASSRGTGSLARARSRRSARTTIPALVEGSQYNRDLAAGHRLEEGDLHLKAAQQQAKPTPVHRHERRRRQKQYARAGSALIQQQKAVSTSRASRTSSTTSPSAAQQKVDPEAAKGTTGAQLFAAIGVAMGAFGASMTGGPNTALQIVNANIDRNIKAQETNIANNKSVAEAISRTLYQARTSTPSETASARCSRRRCSMLDQAKAMADQQYAASKGTINEADVQGDARGIADLRAREDAEEWGDATKVDTQKQANEHYVPPQVVDVGWWRREGQREALRPDARRLRA
jgi:hypothetical protein